MKKRENTTTSHYRRIAGNLELFIGAYLVAFGCLAVIYFERSNHPMRAIAAVVGALSGILLIFRAGRLLGWHRWVYWTIAMILVVVPIAWLGPTLLRAQ